MRTRSHRKYLKLKNVRVQHIKILEIVSYTELLYDNKIFKNTKLRDLFIE